MARKTPITVPEMLKHFLKGIKLQRKNENEMFKENYHNILGMSVMQDVKFIH